ncbi:MAG: ribonuclease E/G [Acidobacteria bacterium]|nr:ribonuclease E/G [Acidobacteriota bacterium]
MPVTRLIREQTIGETRWVALDARGVPAALYLERAGDARRAVIGTQAAARVRRSDAALGGVFVDLGACGEAFLRLQPGETLNDGAAVTVEVAAEARRGKLARVRVVDGAAPAGAGPDRWRASLNGGAAAPVEDAAPGDPAVQAAFDDALAVSVTLTGGGRLHAERTEALVAADIDTSGRTARGGRAANALAVNFAAAEELARQMLLRGWGGLAVLDCVGPVNKDAGGQVRTAFLDAFRDLSHRQVKALAPSPFGLMEISADWQLTPLAERLRDPDGRDSPETMALGGLRQLEAAARQARMGRLCLALPAAAHAWLGASGLNAEARLADVYGARLTIEGGGADSATVRTVP